MPRDAAQHSTALSGAYGSTVPALSCPGVPHITKQHDPGLCYKHSPNILNPELDGKASPKSSVTWVEIVDKFNQRLSRWELLWTEPIRGENFERI
jgi:hypothetical protein